MSRAMHAREKRVRALVALLAAFFPLSCEFSRTPEHDDSVGPTRTLEEKREAPPKPATGLLSIGVEEAILLALDNNPGLKVQRLGPAKLAALQDQAASAYDPKLAASFSGSRTASLMGTGELSDGSSGSVSVGTLLSTGTQVGLDITPGWSDSSVTGEQYSTRAGVSITQPLLQGASRAANLASIRQAELDTRMSEYELRGYAEALVAQVEASYWDCVLAEKQIEIFDESLKLAEEQLRNTEERVRVGKLAEIELAATRAEVASRREALVGARGNLAMARVRLLQLIGPSSGDSWERELVLRETPAAPEGELGNVRTCVDRALRRRPDLNQARLSLDRGELEVVKTKNGLLPRLDLFVSLGRTGYADSFGGAFEDLAGEGYDVSGGVNFEWVFRNRSARSQHRRAVLSRAEAALSVENMERLVQVDVRTAHIAASTAREEIAATAATRTLKEEALRAESEKFRVGRSTTFQVAQAQRDLVGSRISEMRATVGYLKSLVELHCADGSLLARRGIRAPGAGTPGQARESELP